MTGRAWWRGAVIYQIYPRSFADGNGDGVGDLAGIIGRLDYVASLGVDAVWLSPIFASPMKDFGYDVADYRAVDPLFGIVEDVRTLVGEAHARNLRVLLDFVPSHTSDQHPWFQESRESRDNFHTDWYVWSDPSIDGTPPNNWLSVFGGPAWTWEPRRQQYYFHNFLAEQPALNYRAPGMLSAILDEMRFWLDLGVDGFRLDAINACVCDAELRDNPPAGEPFDPGDSVDDVNPFAMQAHVYSQTRPEITTLLERFRALMDEYPETTTIGEVASDDSISTAAEYLRDGRLHMAYTFNLLRGTPTAARVRDVVGRMLAAIGEGWPCWSLSNHDVVRAATRWGGGDAPANVAKVVNAMLLSLRGSISSTRARNWDCRKPTCPTTAFRIRPGGRSGLNTRAVTAAARRCHGPRANLSPVSRPPIRGCRSPRRTGPARSMSRTFIPVRSSTRRGGSLPGASTSRRSSTAPSSSSTVRRRCWHSSGHPTPTVSSAHSIQPAMNTPCLCRRESLGFPWRAMGFAAEPSPMVSSRCRR